MPYSYYEVGGYCNPEETSAQLAQQQNDVTAIPVDVSVVLVSNLTLTQSCHITTTKLQVPFLICQHLNVFYYH